MEHFISQEQEAREDELGAAFGDPRRCSIHGTIISSPDGMFDGLCGACEFASEYPEYANEPDGAGYRMSDAQIREVVGALRMAEWAKTEVIQRAIAGDSAMRFYVFGQALNQGKPWARPVKFFAGAAL